MVLIQTQAAATQEWYFITAGFETEVFDSYQQHLAGWLSYTPLGSVVEQRGQLHAVPADLSGENDAG
jgi:hypothetical protein